MTLKEKFEQYAKKEVWEKKNYNAEECVDIADDFAIGFAKYIDLKYYQHEYDNDKYAMSKEDFSYGNTYTIDELLQIYKKEKGL